MSVDGLSSPRASRELEAFAGAVLHELRTPLATLSGEVDVALRRQRSAGEYRDALKRIADRVGELAEITGDLAFLADRGAAMPPQRASLSGILVYLADRYAAVRGANVTILTIPASMEIAGDERLIVRALTLLLEHGVRHRLDGAALRLGIAPLQGEPSQSEWVTLMLDAAPPAFVPATWDCLGDAEGDWLLRPPGLLRLQAAAAMLRACGASAAVEPRDGVPAVRIRLRRADAGAGTERDG